MEKECSLRHENGNCFHVGGFCTAVPEYLCKALRSAYERGKADAETYIFHCGDTDEPMTHYDEIRSMTVEEMAKFFTGYYYDGPKFWCPAETDIGEGECAKADDCRECFLNWLKQEAKE